MSKFSRFMKQNKVTKKNEMHAVTKFLTDEQGNPLQWEFKHITSQEHDAIRDRCMIDVPITGKPNAFRPKLNTSKYINEMIIASVVDPDLYNAELQNSYSVKEPSELLYAMVDDPGEYQNLGAWVQQFQGFKSLDDKVEEAKN
ncbi:phage tail assembly chaperone [[Clostridium] polysaccharolyticum]|uniref:Phage XkdN-like tail assembly chaperone protein, TAC n=1 Tax=[Clostridium] polysaccharolyticum TaxID=29364 RepID=A0A1H9YHR2_9FIRM|nr:hypothetical protein [[Clostridium] polysaccharolyticum]SES68557.1 Phage XkdN-like tail assembly chaperone protein, TAC [[Clostridium] polysaccharolyticum]